MSLSLMEIKIIVPTAEAEKAILGNIDLESQRSGDKRAAVCVVCSAVCVCRCTCTCNCL